MVRNVAPGETAHLESGPSGRWHPPVSSQIIQIKDISRKARKGLLPTNTKNAEKKMKILMEQLTTDH